MASSSSSAIDSSKYNNYDVFLSFSREDTPYHFTSHLYKALIDLNIKVFMDDNTERGHEITGAIEAVMEDAKMSIIVFSKNYADSKFCLDELVKIMECRELTAQFVLPIFYDVEPSQETYQEAFARHEKQRISQNELIKTTFSWSCQRNLEQMRVEKWKSAFRKAVELPGYVLYDSEEANFIAQISKFVFQRLYNNLPQEELVFTSMVGHTAEENLKIIWEYLMNDEISRIGVYGMSGVGKTTIATSIYDQLLTTDNSFSFVCWVSVSKDLSIYHVQNNIAKDLNLDLTEEDVKQKKVDVYQSRAVNLDFTEEDVIRNRGDKLRERLKIEKFVLILDDVGVDFQIENVGIPPLIGRQKLLLTSRSRRVCEIMKCQPVEVEPLSEMEALELFMKELKYQKIDSLDWREIVESIVKECGGLPLEIIVVARTMRGVDEIWKWRDTLQEIQNSSIEEKVFVVLKVSYDRLPNDRYRQCFLYCSLFPEGHGFEREDLISYWIGEGLVVDEQDCRQAEVDEGNVILDELIDSSLLNHHHFDGFIKMHDVIREMARMNVFKDSLDSVQVCNNPRSVPHRDKLKTLVLQDSRKKLQGSIYFIKMPRINVLHVSMEKGTKISSFYNYLKSLRLLIIKHCPKLRRIPSLVELQNLRHLEISRNRDLRFASGGIIERLVNLRVLDLSDNPRLKVSLPVGAVEKLSHLQTLDLTGSRIEVESDVVISLEKVEIVRIQFYNLHKLNCYVKSGHWRRLLDYQIHYKGSQIKFLRNDKYERMWCIFKNPTLAELQTISIRSYPSQECVELFTVDVAQQLLENVRELVIHDCYGLEHFIATGKEWVNPSNYPTIVLPNLKILELFNLPKLRSIYRGMMECSSLELVQIGKCEEVERLPFCINNKQNPTIKIRGLFGRALSKKWWESLQWDDPNVKSIYQPIFDTENESYFKGDLESETSKRRRVSEPESDSQIEDESNPKQVEDGIYAKFLSIF